MDPYEKARRDMAAEVNAVEGDRKTLEEKHGQVWDTQELQRDFTVIGFAAPFCVVERKSDGKKGSITFQHYPRFYFGFVED